MAANMAVTIRIWNTVATLPPMNRPLTENKNSPPSVAAESFTTLRPIAFTSTQAVTAYRTPMKVTDR